MRRPLTRSPVRPAQGERPSARAGLVEGRYPDKVLAAVVLVAFAAFGEEAPADPRLDEAQHLRTSGRAAEALALLDQVRADAKQKKDPLTEGRALQKQGDVQLDGRACEAAQQSYQQAAKVLAKDPLAAGQVFNDLGLWAKKCATPEDQKGYFKTALGLYQKAKYTKGVRLVANNLGTAYFVGGDPKAAIPFFIQAGAAAKELGDDESWLTVKVNLSLMELLLVQQRLNRDCTAFTARDLADPGFKRALAYMKEAVDVQSRAARAPLALCARFGQYDGLCEPCLLLRLPR